MKKILLGIAGGLIILAGIIGLVLPIIPGWILIFLGLSFIAPKLAARLKQRFLRKVFKKGVVAIEEWEKSRVQAGFTTRHFPLVLQSSEQLSEGNNQEKFASLLPQFKKFVVLNQVHGDKIAVLDAISEYPREGFYRLPGTDGVATNLRGLALLVFSADCLPVFFRAGAWVGVVHAGWRGSQKKICQKMVKLLVERSGRAAKHIRVIFGPSIRVDHYEVGPEFCGYFSDAVLVEKKGKLYFDLAKENAMQLREVGVVKKNIQDYAICTFGENGDFYSFRKEKDAAGRIISFISKTI